VLEDDVGSFGIALRHRGVVVALEQPGFPVEPEALNALCTGRLLAPERVAQEVHEIQPVPASGDAGI